MVVKIDYSTFLLFLASVGSRSWQRPTFSFSQSQTSVTKGAVDELLPSFVFVQPLL